MTFRSQANSPINALIPAADRSKLPAYRQARTPQGTDEWLTITGCAAGSA